MPILKQCSHRGCSKIIDSNLKHCDYHSKKYEEHNKKRYKEYKLRREDKAEQKFYNTDEWKRIRAACISLQNGIDIVEYYRTGKVVQAEAYHHIEELKDNWERRLDVDNIIGLTERNHRRVHAVYLKGDKEKKSMQRTLLALLDKYYKEFKD